MRHSCGARAQVLWSHHLRTRNLRAHKRTQTSGGTVTIHPTAHAVSVHSYVPYLQATVQCSLTANCMRAHREHQCGGRDWYPVACRELELVEVALRVCVLDKLFQIHSLLPSLLGRRIVTCGWFVVDIADIQTPDRPALSPEPNIRRDAAEVCVRKLSTVSDPTRNPSAQKKLSTPSDRIVGLVWRRIGGCVPCPEGSCVPCLSRVRFVCVEMRSCVSWRSV